MISVSYAGTDYKHPKSFVINRPFGTGVYDLILFRTKTIIEVDGEPVSANANSVIIYDRFCRQHYYTDEEYLINDFVHFNIDTQSDNVLIEKLILNKPFPIEQVDAVGKLIWLIAYEYSNNYPNREKNIVHLMNVLLKKMEEELSFGRERENYGSYAKVLSVKNMIMQNPQNNWSISALARECNMSESYFQIAYKRLFGSSCISDVISARLEMAKEFIDNSTYSIREIATYCGYNNTEHFSRQFKNMYGMTPLKFRNQCKNNQKAGIQYD